MSINTKHREVLQGFLHILILLDLTDDDDLFEYVALNICGDYYNRVFNLNRENNETNI